MKREFEHYNIEIPRAVWVSVYKPDEYGKRSLKFLTDDVPPDTLAELQRVTDRDFGKAITASSRFPPRVYCASTADYEWLTELWASAEIRNLDRDILLVGLPLTIRVRPYSWASGSEGHGHKSGTAVGIEALLVNPATIQSRVLDDGWPS